MNYIWETFLTEKPEVRFRQALDFSPYYEVSPTMLTRNDNGVMEFNGMYRFEKIFACLFQEEPGDLWELKENLFDIIVHYLIRIDVNEGMNKKELWMQLLKKKLESGSHGKQVSNIFKRLTKSEQDIISYYLFMQYQTGASGMLFGEVITTVLRAVTLYRNKGDKKELLMHIGQLKTESLTEKVQIIDTLFLPLKYNLRVFWNQHFGLIDSEEAMEIGNIEIF